MNVSTKRESLGSRLGFIFLAAGSAIGLGNVWRFPYITGKYGGAVFVLLYVVFLLFLVIPIMVMEFAVGRASRRSVILAFQTLCPEKKGWGLFGYVALAGNYILMMFYTTVTGWMLAYTWCSAMGQLSSLSVEELTFKFADLLAEPEYLIFWVFLTVFSSATICFWGLREGVERATKFMMTGLFAIMIALMFRALTLPGSKEGLVFYLKPNLDNLAAQGLGEGVYAALGHAFFTLGVGIGSLTLFGSYSGRERSLTGEALIITGLDTFVAITAGLIIFPACFAYRINPGEGPGLIFVTLPKIFSQMPYGQVWCTLLFLFLSFAALSTVIAVFENIIACLIDKLGWERDLASLFVFFSVFLLSFPCVFGFNLWSDVQPLGAKTNILDLEDFLVSNNILPLGSIVYLIFCTTRWGWGWDNFIAEADAGRGLRFPRAFRLYLVWVVPAVVLLTFLAGYCEKFCRWL